MWRRLGLRFSAGILIVLGLLVDCRAAGPPNVVLITIDSLRVDRVGFLGARSGLTPHLDALAQQSLVFERAYAQAPDTVASTATILTGSYPQVHHAGGFGIPLAGGIPYLPDLLHKNGYRTVAFVGSILLDPAAGPFQGYDRGFEHYDAAFHLPVRGEGRYQSVARHGNQVVARAIAWLAAVQGKRFFLWVDLHDPAISGASAYDHAVADADVSVGKLIDFLRSRSLYDDAVVVIAAAHGESLGAHGEDGHGIFLYDETIHVPLTVKLSAAQNAGKQTKNRARLLDVAPTILEAAGIPVSSQMQGQSLIRIAQANSPADQPAYSRGELAQRGFGCSLLESLRAGKYLYIRAPQPELYDLMVDPHASRNLALNSRAILDTMAAQLQALDQRLGSESGKPVGTGLTSSEVQKLASLGYVGLQKAGDTVSAAAVGTDPRGIVSIANKTLQALADLDDGKPERAFPVLRGVLVSQPNSYLAQYGMGVALAQQQKYAEAIGNLHKAIELQPDSPWAHLAMGLSLMKTGDFQTAAVHLEIASAHLPEFPRLHSTLAEVYDHLGRKSDAERERATQKSGQGN